ncbi:hypothetical protein BH09MYX1_BH09MYX1_64230 [soil metagenome]
MARAVKTKPSSFATAKFGSGSFPKISSAIPAIHRFLIGTLLDGECHTREPIVVNKLGLGGAEMRCANAHSTLEPGEVVILEIADHDDLVRINGYVRAVEPSRVIVAFGTLNDDARHALDRLIATYGS